MSVTLSDLRQETLNRVVNELLYTRKSADDILDAVLEDTFYTKFEASLIYIEALEKIVQTVRSVGEENETKKQKSKKSK